LDCAVSVSLATRLNYVLLYPLLEIPSSIAHARIQNNKQV